MMRRTITILLSLIAIIFTSLTLIYWDDLHSHEDLIWDYEPIRLYVLISIGIFALLNAFRKIETIITKQSGLFTLSNLSGLYGYILGTIIYFIIGLITFDYTTRFYGLLIPILLTIIGFHFNRSKIEKKLPRKKLLITVNVVVLTFWLLILIDFQAFLNYRQSVFGADRKYFQQIDAKFQTKSDSLAHIIFDKLDPKIFKQLKNDTL